MSAFAASDTASSVSRSRVTEISAGKSALTDISKSGAPVMAAS